jgi:hypothetical protein
MPENFPFVATSPRPNKKPRSDRSGRAQLEENGFRHEIKRANILWIKGITKAPASDRGFEF